MKDMAHKYHYSWTDGKILQSGIIWANSDAEAVEAVVAIADKISRSKTKTFDIIESRDTWQSPS